MKKYKVEITKEALQDMEDIYNYIAVDLLSPENAMGQYNRIADEIMANEPIHVQQLWPGAAHGFPF